MVVGAANIHDTVVECEVFRFALQKYSFLQGVCGGAGFSGVCCFVVFLGWKDISEKIVPEGWRVLSKCWCVE